MERYYKILDLNTNATEQEVKQAYRELVKVWHPDRFAHDAKLQKRAEEKLKEINDAYQRIVDYLNNSTKRQQSQQYQSHW
ncbi:MAG: DnaJ domain-containing protein [Nitrospirae bacterium]|nr:DnaJ domain-containing protein [Nitrospirota bacterium]